MYSMCMCAICLVHRKFRYIPAVHWIWSNYAWMHNLLGAYEYKRVRQLVLDISLRQCIVYHSNKHHIGSNPWSEPVLPVNLIDNQYDWFQSECIVEFGLLEDRRQESDCSRIRIVIVQPVHIIAALERSITHSKSGFHEAIAIVQKRCCGSHRCDHVSRSYSLT